MPPMTMVYEVYGPSISVGERLSALQRVASSRTSETEWVDTVIGLRRSTLADGVGSNVGSYTRLDGRAVDEYDEMDGSMEESAVSEQHLRAELGFRLRLATPNSIDDTPGLSTSQVVSSATVHFNGYCEENALGFCIAARVRASNVVPRNKGLSGWFCGVRAVRREGLVLFRSGCR